MEPTMALPVSPRANDQLVRSLSDCLREKLRPLPNSSSATHFEMNDFYCILELQRAYETAPRDGSDEIQKLLQECRQKMTESFFGAVFLWGAPTEAGPSDSRPQFQRSAPDFTMMSWNVLCHRCHLSCH
jgi:hypothetical protein